MASRRQIREAVIQFLYSAEIAGGATPGEPFWEFITESERRAFQVATYRTIGHLAQGRDARLAELLARLAPALAKLGAYPEAESLRSDLRHLAETEQRWTESYGALGRLPTDDTDKSAVADQFSRALEGLFGIDRELAAARRRFLENLEDFPTLRGPMEPVAASIRRIQRVSDRMAMLARPEDFPEEADLTKLREAKAAITTLRDRAGLLVQEITTHQQVLDDAVNSVVENYSPGRIDPVDRAVLRLAAYELAHTATPVKVILNEAVELARRFGTTDSHRFVNGLLDPLIERLRPGAGL